MTTTEGLFALRMTLLAPLAYAEGVADDDLLVEVDRVFRRVVGESIANRLADYINDTRASADDLADIAGDPQRLKNLSAIIGMTQ